MAELNIGDAEVKSLQAEIMAKFHATALNMHARYRQSTPHPRSQTASKETSSSYVSTASLLPDEGDDSPCILQMWTDVHIFSDYSAAFFQTTIQPTTERPVNR